MSEKIIFENDQQLIDSLNVNGTSAMNLQSTNLVDHLKKSRFTKIPFEEAFKGDIFCTKEEYVFYGANYQNAVNNQLERENKEANFITEELPWGTWVVPNKIITHKEKYYLRYYVDMNANYDSSKFIYHYADGTKLTEDEIKLLFEEYKSPKQEGSGRQGTDKVIQPRNVKFEGITRIKAGGKILIRKGFEKSIF